MADLATLSDALDYIRPDADGDDAIIARLISWASGQTRRYTQRLLTTPPSVAEQRAIYFTDTKSRRLDDPLTNVTEIVAPVDFLVEGEPYPFERVMDASEYELVQTPIGTTLRFDEPTSGKFLITGTWGWAQVPDDIQMAVIVAADEWYRSNILSAAEPDEDRSEGRNIALPREVKEILDPWRLVELIA